MPTEKLAPKILHSKYVLESRGNAPKSLLVDFDVFNQLRAEGVIYRYLRDDGAEFETFYGLPVTKVPVGGVAAPGWEHIGPQAHDGTDSTATITFRRDPETGDYTASLYGYFHASGFCKDLAVRRLQHFLNRDHIDVAIANRAAFVEYYRVKP